MQSPPPRCTAVYVRRSVIAKDLQKHEMSQHQNSINARLRPLGAELIISSGGYTFALSPVDGASPEDELHTKLITCTHLDGLHIFCHRPFSLRFVIYVSAVLREGIASDSPVEAAAARSWPVSPSACWRIARSGTKLASRREYIFYCS